MINSDTNKKIRSISGYLPDHNSVLPAYLTSSVIGICCYRSNILDIVKNMF